MKRKSSMAAMTAEDAALPDPTLTAALVAELASFAANGNPFRPFFDPSNDVMTPEEVAGYLQLPKRTILAEANAGRIPAKQIGGEWRFLRRAIIHWFETKPIPNRPTSGIGKDYNEDPEEFIRRARAG
jgi:excisionase family DNA binding protein